MCGRVDRAGDRQIGAVHRRVARKAGAAGVHLGRAVVSLVHVVPLVQVGATANGSDDGRRGVRARSCVAAAASGLVALLPPDIEATSPPQPATNATTATASQPDGRRNIHTIYLLVPVPRGRHCRIPAIECMLRSTVLRGPLFVSCLTYELTRRVGVERSGAAFVQMVRAPDRTRCPPPARSRG